MTSVWKFIKNIFKTQLLGARIIDNNTHLNNADILQVVEFVLNTSIDTLNPGINIIMTTNKDRVCEFAGQKNIIGYFMRGYDSITMLPNQPDTIIIWASPNTKLLDTPLVHELIHRYQFDHLDKYGEGHPNLLFGSGGIVDTLTDQLKKEDLKKRK